MDVQSGSSVDEPSLLYTLQRKIKVFNTTNPLTNRGYNLVASSSKYGFVFIGSPEGTLSVYYLKQIIDKECEPQHLSVQLQEKPTHIAVSCDQELLAVTGGQLLSVYKVIDFQNQNVSPSVCVKYDVNPSTFVSALQWNPGMPDTIAIAFFDGTLLVSQVSSSQVKKVQSKARCICWSPKGKQLVTGNSDGTLCQYKPDLTPAKMVPAPNLFEGAPVEALAIYWISTFQFAVVYRNAADNSRPAVAIVNTPKAGQPSCFNHEDICYSMGSNRPWYYYLQGLPQWNIIMCSSSNSMEIATLGSADGANWAQWCQTDEARPELPLVDKKIEIYPAGICIDTCAIHQLPWGENETLPHMPLLLVVSQTGLLTVFNVINLNKDAVLICTPPQQLALPDAALISNIPGETPPQPAPQSAVPAPQPTAPEPVVQPKPHPAPQPVQVEPFAAPATQFGSFSTSAASKPPSFAQPQASHGFAAPVPQMPEVKPAEMKPVAVSQPQAPPPPVAQVQPKPAPAPKVESAKAQEVNAALKAEQERMNKQKVDQELRSMLVKEVNDFQMELHTFVVKSREAQSKLQNELYAIDNHFNFQSLDADQLRKECTMDDLRSAIIQLKLELVRACAVVAEARTHAEAKDLHQWTQADPLTTKRVASVKKLAYYVQTQLEQANKSLDYKWMEISKDQQYNKPGHRMIRPILDDVYQPLVKQQEILSRQQAVLRTLRATLKECDATPMFKSTSLLRSTPFRNKDPLSKLTKNILNMSIEPQPNKAKEALLTPQKLDALRDMLSNHKPVKIKPVNVELRKHLAAMKLNYEKTMKEKALQQEQVKSELMTQPEQVKYEPVTQPVKLEPVYPSVQQPHERVAQVVEVARPDLISKPVPLNVPSFTPVNNDKTNLSGPSNVVRTLFTDEPKQERGKQEQPVAFAPAPITASLHTRSVLKDMLQNKHAGIEDRSDGNTFMGQKICSPAAFTSSSVPPVTTQPPTVTFTSKPIADINNLFTKFTSPVLPKPQPTQPQTVKPKSNETGELETSETKPEAKKEQKPLTNLFAMKTTPSAASSPNVPDVLKSNTGFAAVKPESKAFVVAKPIEKLPETSKENFPDKATGNGPQVQKSEGEKKEPNKPFSAVTNKSVQPSVTVPSPITVSSETQKPVEVKVESKAESLKVEASESSTNSSASTLFAAANAASKSQTVFGAPASPTPSQTSIFSSASTDLPSITASKSGDSVFAVTSASFVFGTTAKPSDRSSQSGSIFTSTPSTAASVFGTAQGSLFGTSMGSVFGAATTATDSKQSTVFGTSSTQSSLSSESKPTVFSAPTPASPSSVFGAAVTTAQSAFGSSTSVFAAATTQPSAFGSPTSVFGSPSITSTAFVTTAQSLFGTATSASSVFGTAASTTQSIFGTSTSTTQSSVFGATTTTPSVFSGPATTQASIFGGPRTTVFGSATPATQSSVFGAPTTQTSVFGQSPAAQSSVFGSAQTTQASVFGSPTQTPQDSVFGTPTQSTQASVFGTPTQTTQASLFGTPTQTTQASVFGTPTQTTQASVFGTTPVTTAQSGSLFGGGESNLFASASISTTSASASASGGSIFGGSPSGSVFGSTNVFGGKTAFSQSNPTATAIFGGGASFAQKPPDNFWAGGNSNAGSGFGSTGFGQQPTTQSSSIFGGGTGGSFSAPSGGQAFGSPQSSVFGSPQQTAQPFGASGGFGAKPAFGQPTGFGSSPSAGGTGFGSFGGFNKSPSSGFGAPASFGGGATFGGTAFGNTSPGKAFGGSGGASPGFGSPTQSSATFENLATQNTLTFGNLAQQTVQPPQPAPSFNTSPSFTGWRG